MKNQDKCANDVPSVPANHTLAGLAAETRPRLLGQAQPMRGAAMGGQMWSRAETLRLQVQNTHSLAASLLDC